MLRAIISAAFRPRLLPVTPLYAAAQTLLDALPMERTPLDLQKLLYICQTVHLGRYGTPIFKETFRASAMGPYSDVVRDAFAQLRTQRFQQTGLIDPSMISVIKDVAGNIGNYSSAHLVAQTQGQWATAWSRNYPLRVNDRNIYSGGQIPHADMADEYRAWPHSALAPAS